MEQLPEQLLEEIRALESVRARDLRKKYSHLLGDMPNCTSNGLLRSFIAYRLQERHYGISLSPEAWKWLHGENASENIPGGANAKACNAQLIRDWNGIRHVVSVRNDGRYEYNGKIYGSLSAVAREITGTRWNGKIFFKVKA